ncbi:hypothetical protein PG999_003560 [Apiospora kogelbergensis]|uniref:Heterokaryon incompatibility domain-containing protein n=1 Tax=Apiospora kogelbergensis TaxID=1337665 RepID=A0AAW0R3Y8_9PEZI
MFSDVKWIAEHLREPPANIGSYTGGSSTRNYVKGRLENCARTHPACQTSNPWVPTRLLEVTTMGPAIRLRVVPTGAWTEKKRYISLSHQWGANPTATPQLTKKTYDAYQDRIPMGRLPRKYIDAIQAAQQLGVQYLWIDSLCIIQDDKKDWERESAQMHRVYRHGFCNLSAASARSDDEGLFYDRDAVWLKPHVVIPGNNMKSLQITQYDCDSKWFVSLDNEPLYGRGWVCQERRLSTRNISYARHLVYFECASEMSSEISGGPAGGVQGQTIRNKRKEEPLFSLRSLGISESRASHDAWRRIVENYSACELTVPTDKLAAIAGVARVFHETIGSTYVAGMWTDNLLQALAWERSMPSLRRFPRPRYSEYIAPSWSWMSFHGPVGYFPTEDSQHAYADCEEVRTVPYGIDPFGRVRSGTLRLRCYAIPLVLAKRDKFGNSHYSRESAVLTAVGKYIPRSSPDIVAECWLNDDPMEESPREEYGTAAAGPRYYAVPLFSELGSVTSRTPFLLLEPRTPIWGLYRRVGVGNLHVVRPGERYVGSSSDDDEDRIVGDMPAICQKGRTLGVPLSICRSLANMVAASDQADIPAHERTDDGRCLITIV